MITPSFGDEGLAIFFFFILPAKNACRPDIAAYLIAIAIANGSLAAAKNDAELKAALKEAQSMSGDADLLAGYFNSKQFKAIKNKVKSILPGKK